jgi:formylglycine-generating enzyme required for sulfatase activity
MASLALCASAGAAAAPATLNIDLGEGIVIEMVQIPAGRYSMGSMEGDRDESPIRVFTFREPFWMGKYEITQAQYERVTGENPSTFRNPQFPVESVSYETVTVFLKKLMAKDVVPADYLPRLPTEAEWEYACRAGSLSDFSCGDASCLDAVAWYAGNSGSSTHTVGTRAANAFGLHDMHGNVWEWCYDWYVESFYRIGLADVDSAGPRSGAARVLRGGSWRNTAPYCRSANRFGYRPWSRDYSAGFRIVLVQQ